MVENGSKKNAGHLQPNPRSEAENIRAALSNGTRRTTAKLARQLRESGIRVGTRTVAKLLRSMGCASFAHITVLRRRGASENIPIISIDTKKKELIGRFKNAGAKWDRYPEQVHDHDLRSLASGVAVPYGIYDLRANTGTVFVGTSSDTPVFAADCVAACRHGKLIPAMIIFADSGDSNGCAAGLALSRTRRSATRRSAGTSKWNPIEHRLFSEISKNWAGVPLIDLETILAYIRCIGLSQRQYQKGIKITAGNATPQHILRWMELPKAKVKTEVILAPTLRLIRHSACLPQNFRAIS